MTENRLDKFSFEELQVMIRNTQSGFSGITKLPINEADQIVVLLHDELEKEIYVRNKAIEDEIERITPRCECCNQRIED